MPKAEGHLRWVGKEPPPERGIELSGRNYKFEPSPCFGGQRIEPVRYGMASRMARLFPTIIEEVQVYTKEFQDEIFWTRIAAEKGRVFDYLVAIEKNPATKPPTVEVKPEPVVTPTPETTVGFDPDAEPAKDSVPDSKPKVKTAKK